MLGEYHLKPTTTPGPMATISEEQGAHLSHGEGSWHKGVERAAEVSSLEQGEWSSEVEDLISFISY